MSLERFHEAQAPVWDQALSELRHGRKRGHWMWFVLPQLRGLGRSETARFYGLADGAEAAAYAAHPVLGPRLVACVQALLRHRDRRADALHAAGIRYQDTFYILDDVSAAADINMLRHISQNLACFGRCVSNCNRFCASQCRNQFAV